MIIGLVSVVGVLLVHSKPYASASLVDSSWQVYGHLRDGAYGPCNLDKPNHQFRQCCRQHQSTLVSGVMFLGLTTTAKLTGQK